MKNVGLPRRSWPGRALLALLLAALLVPSMLQAGPTAPPAAHFWAYVTALGNGAVSVVDVTTGKMVRLIAVDDREDAAGLCLSPDGRRLIVVDGSSRVRVLETATGTVQAEYSVPRVPARVSAPVARLSPDGRSLFIRSGDRGGLRIFDLEQRRVRSLISGRIPCPGPRIVAPGRGSVVYAICPGQPFSLISMAGGGGGYRIGPRARVPVETVADAAAMANGHGVYVLEEPKAGRAWHLTEVLGSGAIRRIDLRRRLPASWRTEEGLAWVAASGGGEWVALGRGHRVAFFRPGSLLLEDAVYVDAPVASAAFTPDGRSLLVLAGGRLVRIATGDRRIADLADGLVKGEAGAQVVVGRAPRAARGR